MDQQIVGVLGKLFPQGCLPPKVLFCVFFVRAWTLMLILEVNYLLHELFQVWAMFFYFNFLSCSCRIVGNRSARIGAKI